MKGPNLEKKSELELKEKLALEEWDKDLASGGDGIARIIGDFKAVKKPHSAVTHRLIKPFDGESYGSFCVSSGDKDGCASYDVVDGFGTYNVVEKKEHEEVDYSNARVVDLGKDEEISGSVKSVCKNKGLGFAPKFLVRTLDGRVYGIALNLEYNGFTKKSISYYIFKNANELKVRAEVQGERSCSRRAEIHISFKNKIPEIEVGRVEGCKEWSRLENDEEKMVAFSGLKVENRSAILKTPYDSAAVKFPTFFSAEEITQVTNDQYDKKLGEVEVVTFAEVKRMLPNSKLGGSDPIAGVYAVRDESEQGCKQEIETIVHYAQPASATEPSQAKSAVLDVTPDVTQASASAPALVTAAAATTIQSTPLTPAIEGSQSGASPSSNFANSAVMAGFAAGAASKVLELLPERTVSKEMVKTLLNAGFFVTAASATVQAAATGEVLPLMPLVGAAASMAVSIAVNNALEKSSAFKGLSDSVKSKVRFAVSAACASASYLQVGLGAAAFAGNVGGYAAVSAAKKLYDGVKGYFTAADPAQQQPAM